MAKTPKKASAATGDDEESLDLALCNNQACCDSSADAELACKTRYGSQKGWANVFARQVTDMPDCGRGLPYRCFADTSPDCARNSNGLYKYNRDGPNGTFRLSGPGTCPIYPGEYGRDICQQKFAEAGTNNAVCYGYLEPHDQAYIPPGYDSCVIADWNSPHREATEGIKDCCNPSLGLKQSTLVCGPKTCFGKRRCDDAASVRTWCSDKDRIATDPACIDTCVRTNDKAIGNVETWCTTKIKAYCQGKKLETDACQKYCSAKNLDSNVPLANFCEDAYTRYCASDDYKTYSSSRQAELCGCIGSPIPQVVCVGATCKLDTNPIPTTIQQRQFLKSDGCSSAICLQNFIVDGKPVINIDNSKWTQYCPGVPVPGGDKSKSNKIDWERVLPLSIIAPLIAILVIAALILLFHA
jgi:hypothetical protein